MDNYSLIIKNLEYRKTHFEEQVSEYAKQNGAPLSKLFKTFNARLELGSALFNLGRNTNGLLEIVYIRKLNEETTRNFILNYDNLDLDLIVQMYDPKNLSKEVCLILEKSTNKVITDYKLVAHLEKPFFKRNPSLEISDNYMGLPIFDYILTSPKLKAELPINMCLNIVDEYRNKL